MNIQTLFPRMEIDPGFCYDITSIETDSRRADASSLFVAIRGASFDAHRPDVLYDLYRRGIRVFVLEEEVALPPDALVFVVPDTRKTLGLIASSFYGHPSKTVKVIGITGTKGKTSTAYLLRSLIERYGKQCALIGTTGAEIGARHIPTKNTTPDPVTLQRLLREAADAGCDYVAMEVSSQAMKQSRVIGTRFLACVFTNLSEDHIGPLEHPSFEDYMRCKRHFLMLGKKVVANADDPHVREMTDGLKKPVVTVGEHAGDIRYRRDPEGSGFTLGDQHVDTDLEGAFNLQNLALALTTLGEIGFSLRTLSGMCKDMHIPGRMEAYRTGGRTFLIDYAHNRMSLTALLEEVHSRKPTGIRLVIGSVGGRTKERRIELPEVASRYVDALYLTSDNPDFEPASEIIAEMARHADVPLLRQIEDRKEAILAMAQDSKPGEILVIAGKGDEEYQLVCGERIPYSDRDVVRSIIEHPPF